MICLDNSPSRFNFLRLTFIIVMELLFIYQTFHNFNVVPYQFDLASDECELELKAKTVTISLKINWQLRQHFRSEKGMRN